MGDCPALSLQIQTRSHGTCPGAGGRPPTACVIPETPHGLFLYMQGPPPAAAEAADSGDGQGFSHLQVGGHADWHLPHGEFPEGTRPNRPALSPVFISPQPATSRGRGVGGSTQLAPGPSAGRWGEAFSPGLPGLWVERCAQWTLEWTAPVLSFACRWLCSALPWRSAASSRPMGPILPPPRWPCPASIPCRSRTQPPWVRPHSARGEGLRLIPLELSGSSPF